jgi:hypothetical protein
LKEYLTGSNSPFMVANSWMQSNEESDARTILGYLLLREMVPQNASHPEILIELMDPENENDA